MDNIKNMNFNTIKVDAIKMQKMVFIYNALEEGWKIENDILGEIKITKSKLTRDCRWDRREPRVGALCSGSGRTPWNRETISQIFGLVGLTATPIKIQSPILRWALMSSKRMLPLRIFRANSLPIALLETL